MTIGFIYLLTNPAMPGYVKIGQTTRVPEDRAGELSAPTGVPVPFDIEYWCLTRDPVEVESEIHVSLAEHRVRENREFFRVAIAQAIQAIDGKIRPAPSRFVRQAPAQSRESAPAAAQALYPMPVEPRLG